MLEEWKYERSLRKLQEKQRKMREEQTQLHKEALNRSDNVSANKIADFLLTCDNVYQDDIDDVITRFLVNKAERIIVPLPDHILWRNAGFVGRRVLSPNGIQELRDNIRIETKKRWEHRFIWIQPLATLLTLLIGLGGLAVAFLSLWIKK